MCVSMGLQGTCSVGRSVLPLDAAGTGVADEDLWEALQVLLHSRSVATL